MDAFIELNDEEMAVWCVGLYEVERSGYYAGRDSVENLKVFRGNDKINHLLTATQIEELESQYLEHCRSEVA